MSDGWTKATKTNRCPLCNSHDWCAWTETVIKCMRVSEGAYKEQQDNSGLAYFHRIDGSIKVHHKPTPKVQEIKDVSGFYSRMGWEGKGLLELSKLLGPSESSFHLIRAGFTGNAWTFPMFKPVGDKDIMCGIRLRHKTGGQSTVTGTHNGLYLAPFLEQVVAIPEGASDTATCLDLGFSIIGRFNCSGGVDMIKCILNRKRGYHDSIIVSDNDEWKYRPDGSRFKPGQESADRLCDEILPLCRSVTIIKPTHHKDIRAWYNAGCTREQILRLMKNTQTFYRERP